ncbi:MAG: T9SS type A sorting domain-containing protein [Bacteroidia bacterium]
MKKFILGIFGLLLICQGLHAQQRLYNAEYFFDTDPGEGHGTALTIASPTDSVNITTSISVGALSSGFHNLFIRVSDSIGHWSLYEGRNFYVQPAVVIPPAAQISAAEYFYDTDPGQGSGTAVAFTTADSVNMPTTASVSSLTPGFHNLFLRTKNTGGVWSLYEGRGFYVQPAVVIPAAAKITAAEYFFDTDPGQGAGTAVSVTLGDSVSVTQPVAVTALSGGFHSLFVRSKNTNGAWSLYEGRSFYVQPAVVNAPAAQISAAEYFMDTDPGQGAGTSIALTTADSVNLSPVIALTTVTPGFHNFFVRTKNTLGVWSLYEGRNFFYQPAVPASAPSSKLVAAEFFFDTDPGQGHGTTLTGITKADSLNMSVLFPVGSLSLGAHNAFMRVKDSTGHWSLYEGRAFHVKNCSITATASANNTKCFGSSDGSAHAIPSGGTLPYTYSWGTTPVQTTDTATGLVAGSYTVTVTDSAGCPANAIATVGQPSAISPSTTVVGTSCNAANGQALVTASGGTGSYTYSWTTVPVQTTSSVSNLAAGTYTVYVTDANHCTKNTTAMIAASTSPSIAVSTTKSKCGKHTGTATATVTGGTSPYSYTWSNGGSTATVDSLHSGVYLVTVSDAGGCTSQAPVTVSDTLGPVIGVNSANPAQCYGTATGSISISVIGGTSPYTYTWSNGSHNAGISFLHAGPYQINVTDAHGCQAAQTINISQPTQETVTVTTSKASCGMSDGNANAAVTGGTTPYTYSWSSGATTALAGNLSAGTYSLVVSDNNGCRDSMQVAVSNNNGPVVTLGTVVNANCSAGTNGSVNIAVTGGTSPYSYSWSNAATTQNLSGVPSGSYHLTVTDQGGCKGTLDAVVTQTPPPAISICEVTVDSATQKNMIEWNKAGTRQIASYKIYKESTSAGVYFLAGTVANTQLSTFIDTLSDPMARSWRYEISQVDSCGAESPISSPHKTMHLTVNQGIGNTINLIWDNYEGLTFGTYYVYRDTIFSHYTKKDSIPNTIFTWTDNNPLHASHLYYRIGIKNPNPCHPSRASINYESSKSNTGNIVPTTGIEELAFELNSLNIFPNPSAGIFNLKLDLSMRQHIQIKVFNIMGQLISAESLGTVSGPVNRQLNLSGCSRGVYFVQVQSDAGMVTRRVVVEY